ncbi:13581_t:CDS:2, partial [Cetraspora pellucida]
VPRRWILTNHPRSSPVTKTPKKEQIFRIERRTPVQKGSKEKRKPIKGAAEDNMFAK